MEDIMKNEIYDLELTNREIEILSSQIKEFKKVLNVDVKEDLDIFNNLVDLRMKLIGNEYTKYDLQFMTKLITNFEKRAPSEEKNDVYDLKQRVMTNLGIDPILKKLF
jgi:hypothetical protein